jgi:hypothetical protein
MNDHFPVRVCFERVILFEASANLPEVVDFAVKDEGDIAGFVRERLVSGLEVNDAEPPDGQSHVRQLDLAMAVGAAMLEASRHLIDPIATRHRLEFQIQETANAAHGKSVTSDR